MSGPSPHFVPTNYFKALEKEEIFPDVDKPLEVDLGCGDGYFVEHMAMLHPERNFLGVERLIGRVARTARRIADRKLTNARVLRLESAYTVSWLLPAESVSRLHLLCPDPWPKKKHIIRRLVNDEEFLSGLERVLKPGGEFLLKTDDEPYFENALESLSQRSAFTKIDWQLDEFPYPETDFERQWLALSKTIHRARWRKAA